MTHQELKTYQDAILATSEILKICEIELSYEELVKAVTEPPTYCNRKMKARKIYQRILKNSMTVTEDILKDAKELRKTL